MSPSTAKLCSRDGCASCRRIEANGEGRPPRLGLYTWFGLFRAQGHTKSKLNIAAVEALADPKVRARYVDLGFEVFPRERQTPEALGALVKADAEKWWPLIKEFGIKANEEALSGQ
jgi:hypothetical protein